jgi:hypothetical protein
VCASVKFALAYRLAANKAEKVTRDALAERGQPTGASGGLYYSVKVALLCRLAANQKITTSNYKLGAQRLRRYLFRMAEAAIEVSA